MNILVVIDGLGASGTLQQIMACLDQRQVMSSSTLQSLELSIRHPSAACRTISTGYDGADSYLGHFEMIGITARANQTFVEQCQSEIIDVFGEGVFASWGYSNTEVIVSNNIEAELGSTINIITHPWQYDETRERAVRLRRLVDANRVIVMTSQAVVMNDLQWILSGVRETGGVQGLIPARLGMYDTSYQCAHVGRGFYEYEESQRANSYLTTLIDRALPFALIGKVCDIFDLYEHTGQLGTFYHSTAVDDVLKDAKQAISTRTNGFVYINFQTVDLQCHARNPVQAAHELVSVAQAIDTILQHAHEDDAVIITADHGNNPISPGNSHTHEDVPAILYTAETPDDINQLRDINSLLRSRQKAKM